ncbi:MAG: MFS transporter [Candidatus Dojkabacteria bacterium]
MRLITFQPHRKLTLITPFALFLAAGFLVLFADSIMSYYFPLVVENTSGSNTLVGVIMAASSIMGLACDLIFPQLFQKRSWKFLLVSGIIISITFPITTNLGIAFSSVMIFLLASILWGIYYEFLSFSQQSFVVSTENRSDYSKDWGIISVLWGIGSLLGPILGSMLVHDTLLNSATIIVAIQLLSLIFAILLLYTVKHEKETSIESQAIKMSISKELIYWFVLFRRLWPPIMVGLAMFFINSTFWTLGGVFGEKILGDQGLDWLIMIMFVLPSIPGAIILARLKVNHHKKLLSEITLLLAGLSMGCIFLVQNDILLVLFLILLISFFLSFTWPLNESVYSDLSDRAGDSKLHITAITRANTSIGYIIGPLLAGALADGLGYYAAFSIIGLGVFFIAGILIVFTPKKLKVPQSKLEELNRM